MKASVASLLEGKGEMRQEEVIMFVSYDYSNQFPYTGFFKIREIYTLTIQKTRNSFQDVSRIFFILEAFEGKSVPCSSS